MKNFIISMFVMFAVFNCTKTENKTKSTNIEQEETPKIIIETFTVDSLKVEDSTTLSKNLTGKFSLSVLVFPTLSSKTLLDSMYSKEKINLAIYSKPELNKELNKKKLNYFSETKKSLKEYSPDFEQTWNESSSMRIFSKNNDLLTIIYSGDGYSGGAHGYYYEFYKNFNIDKNKTYQLSEIVTTQDAKTWYPILLKNYLKDHEEEMLFEKEIPLTDNFYFDDKNITFVYNQYEIAPYVAGVIYIKIPFSEISQFTNPNFKKEINSK